MYHQDMKIEFLRLNQKYRLDLADYITMKAVEHVKKLAKDPVRNEAEINRIIDAVLTPEEQGHVRVLYEIYTKDPTDDESEALLKRQQFYVVQKPTE